MKQEEEDSEHAGDGYGRVGGVSPTPPVCVCVRERDRERVRDSTHNPRSLPSYLRPSTVHDSWREQRVVSIMRMKQVEEDSEHAGDGGGRGGGGVHWTVSDSAGPERDVRLFKQARFVRAYVFIGPQTESWVLMPTVLPAVSRQACTEKRASGPYGLL